MAATLIVEDGTIVQDANSYVTQEFADAFFDTLSSPGDWPTATEDAKARLLIQATTMVDTEVIWSGTRIDASQDLAWPRDGMIYDGVLLAPTTMPKQLLQAVCYTARDLQAGDPTQQADASGVKKLGLGQGAIEVEFDATTARTRLTDFVRKLLAPFGTTAKSMQVPVFRG